ncbi:hypothetical protein ACP4OV_028482 [Aristida adscensionis]
MRSDNGHQPIQDSYTSLPFNKYAFLTTHNSFSIHGEPSRTGVPRITLYNQEDSVTDQLNNGVRALMLDVYDFRGDIWLCHSKGGRCFDFTAFVSDIALLSTPSGRILCSREAVTERGLENGVQAPAIETMREVAAFLAANPSEVVTLILEDYVRAERGLPRLFRDAGLARHWFPASRMPRRGEDWPRVRDMVARGHRLLVFTSAPWKQAAEGIAYQWDYMVENQYGDGGMRGGECRNRSESPKAPRRRLMSPVSGLQRSDGGGVFAATDMLNGMLICGRDDVHACKRRTLKDVLHDLLGKLELTWRP